MLLMSAHFGGIVACPEVFNGGKMIEEETRKALEVCIRFWESKLKDKYLMDAATTVLVKQTIDFLKELRKIKDK